MITIAWSFSLLWLLPIIGWPYMFNNGVRYVPSDKCNTEYDKNITFKLTAAIFNFYLPLLAMILINTKIFLVIRRRYHNPIMKYSLVNTQKNSMNRNSISNTNALIINRNALKLRQQAGGSLSLSSNRNVYNAQNKCDMYCKIKDQQSKRSTSFDLKIKNSTNQQVPAPYATKVIKISPHNSPRNTSKIFDNLPCLKTSLAVKSRKSTCVHRSYVQPNSSASPSFPNNQDSHRRRISISTDARKSSLADEKRSFFQNMNDYVNNCMFNKKRQGSNPTNELIELNESSSVISRHNSTSSVGTKLSITNDMIKSSIKHDVNKMNETKINRKGFMNKQEKAFKVNFGSNNRMPKLFKNFYNLFSN